MLANVSSYVVGVVMVGLLMLAIQDVPAIMESALPVKDILDTAVGSALPTSLRPSPSSPCSPPW